MKRTILQKNGTSNDVFRIESGAEDYDKIGVIESLNGETEMGYWKTDKCE